MLFQSKSAGRLSSHCLVSNYQVLIKSLRSGLFARICVYDENYVNVITFTNALIVIVTRVGLRLKTTS